ncbi:MAG: hypothetical protein ACLP2Y_01550, partial [Limisphaerales bacterium]
MKTGPARILASLLMLAGVVLFASPSFTQTTTPAVSPSGAVEKTAPKATPYQITERGANDRVWERYTYEKAPDGTIVPKKHRFVELATSMHYLKNGQWVESQEQINILPQGGAESIQCDHQVFYPGDIYKGVIEMVTPDGEHLKSRPVGICYDDGSNTVLVAQLQDSVGELTASNRVVYPDAFTGIKADLVYKFRKSGAEQDIVLWAQPPSPASLGLNPQTAKLQVLTEFFDAPEPVQAKVTRRDGLSDATLTFGSMKMIHGKAFSIGGGAQSRTEKVSVAKSWIHLQGRTFLIEEVPVQELGAQLDRLPAPAGANGTSRPADPVLYKVSAVHLLPPNRSIESVPVAVQLARADNDQKPHMVLDYDLVTSQSGFCFQADTTYYVNDSVNLDGTTTIEGGTVIKYGTNYTCAVNIFGNVNCETTPYRPAVLTSVNDSTVGEPVSSSSPSPCSGLLNFQIVEDIDDAVTWYVYDDNGDCLVNGLNSNTNIVTTFFASPGEEFYFDSFDGYGDEYAGDFWTTLQYGLMDICSDGSLSYSEGGNNLCTVQPCSLALYLANGGSLNNLCIRNVGTGVECDGNCSVTNLQFVQCGTAFDTEYASLYAGNILMSGVGTGFYGHDFQVTAEHLTFDQGTQITSDPGMEWWWAADISSVSIVNSLITSVGSYGNASVYTNAVVTLASDAGVYQTVGAGSYYLATNSPYRNAGTASISPTLQAQLAQKTTYPPIVYFSRAILVSTNLSPQVRRDTSATPDLGYHYDPLDYVFAGVEAQSNITFTAGTAVGWYDAWGGNAYGIIIDSGAVVSFNGTVTAPCWLARYDTVQENGNGNWTDTGWLAAIT